MRIRIGATVAYMICASNNPADLVELENLWKFEEEPR